MLVSAGGGVLPKMKTLLPALLCAALLTACPSPTPPPPTPVQDGGADAGADGGPDAGTDAGSCPAGQTQCGASCFNLSSDPAHCGSCTRSCTASESCEAGACKGLPADCRNPATPCPAKFYCDLGSGQCKSGCATDTQCPQPGSCEVATHTCRCATGNHFCGDVCRADTSPLTCGTRCTPCSPPANAFATCDGVSCGFTCNAGFHRCGDACVPNTAVSSCGGSCTPCTPPANATPTCDGQSCGFACNAGYHACNGACVPNNSVNTCGASACTPCVPPANSVATCDGTACGFTCNTGLHACSGACVSNTALTSCGTTSCTACPVPANGSATCNGVACGVACNTGYHACNGQCAINTSISTCGSSCTPCVPPANANATCDGVSCGFTCKSGYHLCNGACVSNYSVSSCGSSCTACPTPTNGTATCNGVSCGASCVSGYHACGTQCLSNTSVSSCGTSCTPCPVPPNGSATCNGVSCGISCAAGFHPCGDACVPDSSPAGCGSACAVCAAPGDLKAPTCSAGTCGAACRTSCGGTCVDVGSDNAHCGACGVACGASEQCSLGQCAATCAAGQLALDGPLPFDTVPAQLTSLAVADVNGDGTKDLLTTGPGGMVALKGLGSGRFAAQTGLGASNEWPPTLVDVNGDGRLDLLYASTGLYVYPGTADAAFGAFTTRTLPASGRATTSGDFNGDGRADVAVLSTNGNAYVLLATATDLGAPAVAGFTSSSASRIRAADFNGDGKLDLLAIGSSFGYLLTGKGDGTFNAATSASLPLWVRFAVGDVTGDGKADFVATTNTATQRLAVYPSTGTGFTVATPPPLPRLDASSPVADASNLALADMDGDGKLDLITAEATRNVVLVSRGLGGGSFEAARAFFGPGEVFGLDAADVTGDGKVDLVLSSAVGFGLAAARYCVAVAKGTGALVPPGYRRIGTGVSGTASAAGDFNADGKVDVAVTTSNGTGVLNVYLGVGPGEFNPTPKTATFGYGTSELRALDFNADGKTDLAFLQSNTGNSVNLVATVSNGDGTFTPLTATGLSRSTYVLPFAVGNFDGQPGDELVTSVMDSGFVNVLAVWRRNAAGTALELVGRTKLADEKTTELVVLDANGDGALDLAMLRADAAAGLQLALGTGSGSFVLQPTMNVGTVSARSVVVGDFDRDTHLDLAVIGSGVAVLLGQGNGTFAPLTVGAALTDPDSLVVTDSNVDGKPDLLVGFGSYGDRLQLLTGNGDGTFTAGPELLAPVRREISGAELDGDHRRDVVIVQEYNGYETLYAPSTCR